MSSICIYSLGSFYKNKGTIIRYELLKKDNIMIIGGSQNEFNLISNSKYFLPYKSQKIFGSNGLIFEDIYEKVGNPIKIDTIDKWKLYFENDYKYCDDIENKPNNPIDNFRCMISNGGYDILWKVKKIKQITLEKKNLSSLPYRSRISKISIDNKNYSLIENLINRKFN